MQTGEAIWNLAAILHYLERKHSTDAQMLRLLGLGQESCQTIAQWAEIDLPDSDRLQTYVTFFDNKFFPNMDVAARKSAPKAAGSPDAERACKLCKAILAGCERLAGNERAVEFAESVNEKAESILEWVTEKGHVTGKQLSALENMKEAVDKWLKKNTMRGEDDDCDYDSDEEL